MKTNQLLKYWFYRISFVTSTMLVSNSVAAQVQLPTDLRPDYIPTVSGGSAEEKIFNFSGNLIVTILQIVGGVAIVLIIFNGFQYIIAHGEDGEIDKAKTNILWIVGGLLLLMVSYIVIRFVLKVTLVVDEAN